MWFALWGLTAAMFWELLFERGFPSVGGIAIVFELGFLFAGVASGQDFLCVEG